MTKAVAKRKARGLAKQKPSEVFELFIRTRGEATLRTYKQALEDFSRWLGTDDPGAAAVRFLGLPHGEANAMALDYQQDLLQRPIWTSKKARASGAPNDRVGYSPATVNRYVAALRSLAKLGRSAGQISWALELPDVRATPYRDTAGPGREAYFSMLSVLDREVAALGGEDRGQAALRDRSMLRLLHDLGLRRAEVVRLDMEDLELRGDRGRVMVLGKGKRDKVPITLSTQALSAMLDWVKVRGRESGPLYQSFHHAHRGGRLTPRALNYLLTRLAKKAGIERATPHGLRHTAITTALDRTGGDIRKTQAFSRHAKPDTVKLYDDARQDFAGEVSDLIADDD